MDVGQISANLGFNWQVALANLANFLIIVWILKKFAFKPIEKILKERNNIINKGVEDAEKATTELQMAEQISEKTVMSARGEANKIIAAAQRESEKIALEGRALQEECTKQMIEKANKMIQQEKQKMMADTKKEVINLVISATERFIKEDLTKEKQEQIIKKLIKDEI